MTRHALILAAGKGSRFGYPKSWISLHGIPLIQAHINAIKSYMPVRAIVSNLRQATILHDCTIIHNPHGTSMKSSITLGIEGLENADHVLIVPVDTVPITEEMLNMLIQYKPPAVMSYNQQAGHPIWLSVKSIRNLHPNQTLQTLSQQAQHCLSTKQCLTNFNYPQDWIDFWGERPRRWNKSINPTKK